MGFAPEVAAGLQMTVYGDIPLKGRIRREVGTRPRKSGGQDVKDLRDDAGGRR
jgi:hypothetical protein